LSTGAAPSQAGQRIVHADLPIVASPSGLPLQHLVSGRIGARALYVGQQWLQPGDRVLLHTHPVEEVLTFLAGDGEATLDSERYEIGAGVSLYVPPGVVHGFGNTGRDTLHLIVTFPLPHFAPTQIVEPTKPGSIGDDPDPDDRPRS
jgi:quercetin dioxygenase-like cupin family protein